MTIRTTHSFLPAQAPPATTYTCRRKINKVDKNLSTRKSALLFSTVPLISDAEPLFVKLGKTQSFLGFHPLKEKLWSPTWCQAQCWGSEL